MNLSVGRTPVATHDSGDRVPAELSPRPYLHPVRTLAGTEVTETFPDDHRHHLGVSVTLADVAGTSFWGGRTFTREHGSVMLDNHGRQEHLAWDDRSAGWTTELLSWVSPEGTELLREERTTRALPLDSTTWVLDLRSSLRNTSGRELGIGSPATNGRPGAGYGGVFWRAPIGDQPPTVTGPDGMSGRRPCTAHGPGGSRCPRPPREVRCGHCSSSSPARAPTPGSSGRRSTRACARPPPGTPDWTWPRARPWNWDCAPPSPTAR